MSGPVRDPHPHEQELIAALHRIHELAAATAALDRVLAFGGADWIVNTAARERHETMSDVVLAEQRARSLVVGGQIITAVRHGGQTGHRWIDPEPEHLSTPQGMDRWARRIAPEAPPTAPGIGAAMRAEYLPAQTTRWLREVQHLAAEVTRMRQAATLTAAGGDVSVLALMVTRVGDIDRHREATEVRAHAAGVSLRWIAWARTRGQVGREWDPDQALVLPVPDARHRAAEHVTDDMRHVTDMAALAVVRDHQHHTDPGTDRSVARKQFARTMDALWFRAARTAQIAGLTPQERGRIWSTSTQDCYGRVAHLLHLGGEEIDALWDQYSAPEIAEQAHHSFDELAHAAAATNVTSVHAATELLPPAPHYFLDRARHTLDRLAAITSPAQTGIGTAVAEIIPAADQPRAWETETDLHGRAGTDTIGPPTGPGPDP
ncbi:hypothetical protein [Nocardia vaccinii]|uniref:hypothetical protein n=1 Tax=Nocardia vaccinii TaxID=1822 RepID=UPI00082D7912|nr:hypothetical protein [Nocardia vaccinii]